MGNTPNNNFPFPESTDLVKDGAQAIEDLADAIDTTLGVYAPSSSGLELINTTSFSAVSSVSLPASTFTATYKHYKVIFNLDDNNNGMTLTCRMRASGSDDATSVYQQMTTGSSRTGASNNQQSNASSWQIGTFQQFAHSFILDVSQPQLATRTYINGHYTIETSGDFIGRNLHLLNGASTQFDSMSFIASTGNLTGSVSVFGFAL
jgi:hypothetical protein